MTYEEDSIERICETIHITKEEENFFATYNPARFYSVLVDLGIFSKDEARLFSQYHEKIYNNIVDKIKLRKNGDERVFNFSHFFFISY